MKVGAKKVALCGVLAELAFALSYLEMLLPSFGIVGAKLGLANIAILTTMYMYGVKEASAVSLVRIILSFLLFGSVTGLIYSLSGAVLSLLAMSVLIKIDRFSPIGVSAAGGVCHNIGQLLAARVILGEGVLGYLPALLIFGVLSGAVMGLLTEGILRVLKKERI